MKYKWPKKVDLTILAESLESFLKNSGFKTKRTEIDGSNSYIIIGILQNPSLNTKRVLVLLEKTSEGVTVDLRYGELEQTILKLGSFISYFGGGALFLKAHKEVEFYRKFEEKFWDYVQKEVSKLDW
jgi:hypothetical protein